MRITPNGFWKPVTNEIIANRKNIAIIAGVVFALVAFVVIIFGVIISVVGYFDSFGDGDTAGMVNPYSDILCKAKTFLDYFGNNKLIFLIFLFEVMLF